MCVLDVGESSVLHADLLMDGLQVSYLPFQAAKGLNIWPASLWCLGP